MLHCTKLMIHLQSEKDAEVLDQEKVGDSGSFSLLGNERWKSNKAPGE